MKSIESLTIHPKRHKSSRQSNPPVEKPSQETSAPQLSQPFRLFALEQTLTNIKEVDVPLIFIYPGNPLCCLDQLGWQVIFQRHAVEAGYWFEFWGS